MRERKGLKETDHHTALSPAPETQPCAAVCWNSDKGQLRIWKKGPMQVLEDEPGSASTYLSDQREEPSEENEAEGEEDGFGMEKKAGQGPS